jgi:hypothetical protein
MQGMWKDALEIYTRIMRVSYLRDILKMDLFYRSCYQRRFRKKKKENIELSSGDEDDFEEPIYLSSGDEDDVLEIKPKVEEMEPCCSSSLKD